MGSDLRTNRGPYLVRGDGGAGRVVFTAWAWARTCGAATPNGTGSRRQWPPGSPTSLVVSASVVRSKSCDKRPEKHSDRRVDKPDDKLRELS
jgi:hypothetical protein